MKKDFWCFRVKINFHHIFALQLNAEIAGYSEARERELPLVQEVDSKVKELREMIAGLNSNQMSLRTSFRNLKDKTGQMDEKVRMLIVAPYQSFISMM